MFNNLNIFISYYVSSRCYVIAENTILQWMTTCMILLEIIGKILVIDQDPNNTSMMALNIFHDI